MPDLPSPTVDDVEGDSFTLNWPEEDPPELMSDPPRTINEYAVTVTPEDGGPSQTFYVPAEANATLEVTGLDPETPYDIYIDAVIDTEGQGEDVYNLGAVPLNFETGQLFPVLEVRMFHFNKMCHCKVLKTCMQLTRQVFVILFSGPAMLINTTVASTTEFGATTEIETTPGNELVVI